MLPWAIAATRGKSNQAAIGIINLLLGWTFIGWIVALVMACQAHQVAGGGATTIVVSNLAPAHQVAVSAGGPAAGWFPAPDGNGRQYWDGTLDRTPSALNTRSISWPSRCTSPAVTAGALRPPGRAEVSRPSYLTTVRDELGSDGDELG